MERVNALAFVRDDRRQGARVGELFSRRTLYTFDANAQAREA
jgi:hypothetical protein